MANHKQTYPVRILEDLPGRHEIERESQLVGDLIDHGGVGMAGMIRGDQHALPSIDALLQIFQSQDLNVEQMMILDPDVRTHPSPESEPYRT